MGISYDIFKYVEKRLNDFNKPINMLEFGAQRLVVKTFPKSHPVKKYWLNHNQQFLSSRDFFKNEGIEFISVDINKKFGSLYLDLSLLHDKWKHAFDIVTNFGTTEHVNGGQWESFVNCHNFCKINGIMMHSVPCEGRIQRGHSIEESVYYSKSFFDKLAEANEYEVLDKDFFKRGKRMGGDHMYTFKKVYDREFMCEEDFWKMEGVLDYSKNKKLTRGKGK